MTEVAPATAGHGSPPEATPAVAERTGQPPEDRTRRTRRWRRWRRAGPGVLAALGTGVVLCLSLPPWGWWPLAPVGLVLLDRLVADQPGGVRFRRGALVAAGIFFPALVWMAVLTAPGYVIASAAYSLMLGAGVAAAPPGRGRWLALPGTWALAELLRWSWPFGGVPIGNLAIGQVAGPLAPVLRVGGALLLVVTTLAAGMACAAAVRRQWRWTGGLAAGVAALVVAATLAPQGRDVGTAEVALVQGGGPQGTRKTSASVIEVFDRHVAATDGVRSPVDLVVWPEDVVDTRGALVDDPWSDVIAGLARDLDAPMIVGAVEGAGPEHFRNALVLYDAGGEPVGRYDKVHRVPFGEYTPLRWLLEPVAGDTLQQRDAIPGEGPAHLDTPSGRMATPISWEIFFGDRAREGIRAGGAAILNPTNGATFTGTIVQTQQVAASRMRAIENGRAVLQVAPTGFSAVIAPDGTVVERSTLTERQVIQREVPLREGQTIYTRAGHAPALVLALAGIIAGWGVQLRRRRAR